MAITRSARQADYAFKLGKYSAEQLRVLRFSGSEGVSELFRFQVDLASEDKNIKFDDVVGKPAGLTIYGDAGERWMNGIVSMFEQAGEGLRFKYYRAEIVPALWRLENRYQSRIFQDLSVPDIIKKVLEGAGLAKDQFRFALQKTYRPREYCVQYRETELNFIVRLMEEEGIFYFFEHTKDSHILIMGDSPTAHVPIEKPETVDFYQPSGLEPSEEHVYEYRYTQELRPGSVMLRDFNFKKTKMNLQKEAKGQQEAELEIYDYPGEYEEPDVGQELAKVRLEEVQATRQMGMGQSTCRRLQPGYRFKLDKHPQGDFNKEYLLLRVTHQGAQLQALEEMAALGSEGSSYENRFECIPSDVPYRPPRRTPRPVVRGIQTAIVVGPSGEEVYTDEHGRVKVQFHWDREGQYDEKSSCWIRVSQGWAGGNYGMMFLPRIGHEVIVDFLEGDPDRPLIVGRVYNGDERPPYKLPDEKTKSTIKSSSSKGYEGSNEIRFEDAKGKEQLFLHAEKDLEIRAKGDRKESIEKDRHLTVGGEQRELVEKKKHVHVKDAQAVWIEKDSNLTVGGNLVEEFQKNHAETVKQEHNLSAQTIIVEGKQELMIKAPGGFVKIDASGITIQGNLVMINSGGAPSVPSAVGLACVAPQDPAAAVKAVYGKDTAYAQAPPAPPTPPPKPTKTEKKTHWIEYQFVDGSQKPVSGLPYKFTDTMPKTEKGKLPKSGSLSRKGIPAGTCDVLLGTIDEAVWGATQAGPNEEVEMIAQVSGFEPGTAATIDVFKLHKETPAEVVQKLNAKVTGTTVKSKWKYKYRKEDEGTRPQFVFRVGIGEQWVVSSNVLEIRDWIEIDLKDARDKVIANSDYTLIFPNDERRRGKSDAHGHISEKNLPIGDCRFVLDKYAKFHPKPA